MKPKRRRKITKEHRARANRIGVMEARGGSQSAAVPEMQIIQEAHPRVEWAGGAYAITAQESERIKALIGLQTEELLRRFEEAKRSLIVETFGDNLPQPGEWNIVYFQENPMFCALVPSSVSAAVERGERTLTVDEARAFPHFELEAKPNAV